MFVKDAFKDAMNHFSDNPIILIGVLMMVGIVILSSISPSFKKMILNYFNPSSPVELVSGSRHFSNPPAFNLKDNADYFAIVSTSKGSFTIDLFEEDTPRNVNNFVFLIENGFYNGLNFFIARDGVLTQGGDPKGDGLGTPGYTIKDEIDPSALGLDKMKVKEANFLQEEYSEKVLQKYASYSVSQFYARVEGYTWTPGYGTTRFRPYTVGMANSGPNTNGCQFFVTGKFFNSRLLDGRYTAIGKVIAGQSVVDSIIGGEVDKHGWLVHPVEIISIKIVVK